MISLKNMTEGEDTRTLMELTPPERKFLIKTIFGGVGFAPEDAKTVDNYSFTCPETLDQAWSGKAEVTVYSTDRSEAEDMYLHKISYPDGKEEYLVAPQDFRL